MLATLSSQFWPSKGTTVKGEGEELVAVEAADVDVDAVGVGARGVEGVDAAGLAELVDGDAGVEAVRDEGFCAGEEGELGSGDDEVEEAFLAADGAVAVERLGLGGGDAETDGAAVATAFVGLHLLVVLASYRERGKDRVSASILRCSRACMVRLVSPLHRAGGQSFSTASYSAGGWKEPSPTPPPHARRLLRSSDWAS